MGKVVINILPVGQGAMNLIEGYDDSNNLTDLLLIDMGNKGVNREEFDESTPVGDSINYVCDKMAERLKSSNNQRKLDLLLVTHRDTDHYSFVKKLFNHSSCSGSVFSGWIKCNLVKDGYKDIYTAYGRTGEVKFERCSMPEDSDEATPSMRLNYHLQGNESGTASLNYEGNGFSVNANCNIYHNDDIAFCYVEYVYTSNRIKYRKFISSRYSISGEYGEIMADYEKETHSLKPDQPPSNIWEIFLGLLDSSVVGYFRQEDKEIYIDYFSGKWEGIYKTSEEVYAISATIPGEVSKPIYRCIIGGAYSKSSESAMDNLRKLSKEIISVSRMKKDVLKLKNGTSYFKLLQYYDEDDLEDPLNKMCVGDTYLSNAASAVGLFYEKNEAGIKFLFPGDATRHTFTIIQKDEALFNTLKDSYWLAPHHGSIGTLDDRQGKFLPALLKEANVKHLIISAGYFNSFGHPNASFIKKFSEAMSDCEPKTAHDICINANDSSFNSGARWVHGDITVPIYTVLECEGTKIGYVGHSFEYMTESPANIEHYRYAYINSENLYYAPTNIVDIIKPQRKARDPWLASFFRR